MLIFSLSCFLFYLDHLSNVELTGCGIAYLWPQIAKTRHILPKFHSVLCSSASCLETLGKQFAEIADLTLPITVLFSSFFQQTLTEGR